MSKQDDVSIWMPVYISDLLAMTTRLTTEQVGGLYLLMMDYWKNGAIPNDVKIIGAITGLSSSKVKAFIKTITNIGIFSIENDELFSAYLDDKKIIAIKLKPFKTATDYNRLAWSQWKLIRQEIFNRDNFTCSYCGATDTKLECDHIHPISKGGTNDLSNLVTACESCNRSKGSKTLEEWKI